MHIKKYYWEHLFDESGGLYRKAFHRQANNVGPRHGSRSRKHRLKLFKYHCRAACVRLSTHVPK